MFIILIVFIFTCGTVQAQIIHVKHDASGLPDGTSWDTAYTTINDALVNFNLGDQIWVARGTYSEALTIIDNQSGLLLYGGFAGTENNLADRDAATNVTIIDGSEADAGSAANNVVKIDDAINVILDGFTITGGHASAYGGGIKCTNLDNTNEIAHCIIRGNYAGDDGGGVYLTSSSPTLSNCAIIGNQAGSMGGGLGLATSNAALIDCTISGNYASSDGGGLNISGSVPTLTNCIISGNEALLGGGAATSSTEFKLTNCIISGNKASSGGGGIYMHNYTEALVLTNCTISENSSGLYGEQSVIKSKNCIFDNNHSYAISLDDTLATISNCLFYNNSVDDEILLDDTNLTDVDPWFVMSGDGALSGTWATAVYDSDSNATTLTDNRAAFTSGNLAGRHINPDTNQILQGVILDNQAQSVTVLGDWSSAANKTYLLIDYHIRYDSGALDQGDNTDAPAQDLDGDARPYNSVTDIGVDEYNPTTSDSDADGTPDNSDDCPDDPAKTEPGTCGCGTPDSDSNNDGTIDCLDGCPDDPYKTAPGVCGCGTPDNDSDSDGTLDCLDDCPYDAAKTEPGFCGCGTPDTDSDGDGTLDCLDGCPGDADKTAPGACGCGTPDIDANNDGTIDCLDDCPDDADKTEPGACGCGTPDTDSDGDGTPDCLDDCPDDADKTEPGFCGCGTPDTDSDSDGTPDCIDACPDDPDKTETGFCGCGTPDTDSDGSGTLDCLEDSSSSYSGCFVDSID